MTEFSDRLAVYSMDDDGKIPHAVTLILDVLTQVNATVAAISKAVEALDRCDDLRAAEIAALTARVAALEAVPSVKV